MQKQNHLLSYDVQLSFTFNKNTQDIRDIKISNFKKIKIQDLTNSTATSSMKRDNFQQDYPIEFFESSLVIDID